MYIIRILRTVEFVFNNFINKVLFWEVYLENGRKKVECAGNGRRKGAKD
jgi:hypothetical protein